MDLSLALWFVPVPQLSWLLISKSLSRSTPPVQQGGLAAWTRCGISEELWASFLGLSASPFLRAGALTIGVFFEGTLLWGLTTSKEPMLTSNGFHIKRHRPAASLINLSVDSCLEVWYTPIVSIWLTGAHPIYSTAIQTSRILPWNFTLRHGGQGGRGSMGWRLFPDRKWPRSA